MDEITPARIFTGRVGTSYPTSLLLRLRADHAAARDAVGDEFDLTGPRVRDLAERYDILAAHSAAQSLGQYLRRPELGRSFSTGSVAALASCPRGRDVQLVLGDGLSATALYAQLPWLLPPLVTGCEKAGWTVGRVIFVQRCRVGILNQIGDLLRPRAVVLLIGERPGLATAESLSAYFAYQPRPGHTDAHRNLISNIHDHGVTRTDAIHRILAMIDQLMTAGTSGVAVKEQFDRTGLLPPAGRPAIAE